MVIGAGLPVHGHEAPGAGRDREAADAAAPAFGTEIEFELTDASCKRVRAGDLRGRWLLIFFGYTYIARTYGFDACILPLSGNAEQLARAAGSLGVVFYKVPGPTPDEYTFAHNAIVTLVGPEVVVRIPSRRMYLWRAVDDEGEILDMLVRRRRADFASSTASIDVSRACMTLSRPCEGQFDGKSLSHQSHITVLL
jgi:cytochrome oxidase Cu insertion factor (SCO1/SenC/PrrC family)